MCAFVAVPASADMTTVNIDFQPISGDAYSGLGIAADSGTYWNKVGIADVSDLLASDGVTATTIDVSSTYVRTYGTDPGNELLRDRIIFSPIGPPAINISGLDAGLQYNIYLYAGYYGQEYAICGVSKQLTALPSDPSDPFPAWDDDQPSWVEGTHYVSFLGVAATGGTLDIDIFDVGLGTNPWRDSGPTGTVVSGMQIQAVPVPGAILLGILGLSSAGLKLRKHA